VERHEFQKIRLSCLYLLKVLDTFQSSFEVFQRSGQTTMVQILASYYSPAQLEEKLCLLVERPSDWPPIQWADTALAMDALFLGGTVNSGLLYLLL
jgi:hypothetical protein